MVNSTSLPNGASQSCGCLKSELTIARKTTHGATTHEYRSPEYRAWQEIKKRCYNPNNSHYEDYGGRGISVCERWLKSFTNFLEDMGERPPNKTSIGRLNNDGNYESGNCRWEDDKQQARNKSSNRLITFKNETLCLSEMAEKYQFSYDVVRKRLNRGWSTEEAIMGRESSLCVC